MRILLTILVVFSLMLLCYKNASIAAQDNQDRESSRLIIKKLQEEIEEAQSRVSKELPVSEVAKLKRKIQWNQSKIKELLPSAISGKDRTEKSDADTSGLERYMVIVQKNLFKPLGSGQVVDKKQEFAVAGILGKSAIIMQLKDGPGSYYVSEGESFGNGARLALVEENRVTIVYEGKEMQLKLGEGVPSRRRSVERVGKQEFQKDEEGGDGAEEEIYEQEIEEAYRYLDEAEQIISEFGSLL